MRVSGYSDLIPGACGLGHFCDFCELSDYDSENFSLKNEPNGGGAKYAIASFIPTDVCEEAYKILKKRFKIVFQSEVRRNSNSGNQFFFCVYDTKGSA